MANIISYVNKIKTALYGKDVRGSLANGLEAVNKETEAATALSNETKNSQTSLEKKYDDQIANMTNENPSISELVDFRTSGFSGISYNTAGKRADVIDFLIDSYSKVVNNLNDLFNHEQKKQNLIAVYATDFGVVADGETDDSDAFQTAILKVEEMNESVIVNRETGFGAYKLILPRGKIKITKPLTYSAHGLIVEGAGRHGTIILNRMPEPPGFIDSPDNLATLSTFVSSNIRSYKQRITMRDFSIDLGQDCKNRVGINFTATGQSNIDRVSIWGDKTQQKGRGVYINAVYENGVLVTAGHLNSLFEVVCHYMEYPCVITGGSNANKIRGGEFFSSKNGLIIDTVRAAGGANYVEGLRLENCVKGVYDNSNYTRYVGLYLDSLTTGFHFSADSAYPYIIACHTSPTVQTRIQKDGVDRKNSITEINLAQFRGEQVVFDNGSQIYGGVTSHQLEIRTKQLYAKEGIRVDKALILDARPVQAVHAGTTANRPTDAATGYQYYDQTIQKPVWWNGANWKDATGVIV